MIAKIYSGVIYLVNIFKYITIVFLLLCIILPSGCASSDKRSETGLRDVLSNFKGEPVLPREANRIIIPVFNNIAKKPEISELLTVKVREAIYSDSRLAVVSGNEADLILSGVITGYYMQPVKFDGYDRPVKKRLKITASIKLFDLKKEREIFFEREIQAFEEFSEIIPPITTEMRVLEKVIADLASRIALKTINGWYTKLLTPEEKGKK
jgi:hypothetical protein